MEDTVMMLCKLASGRLVGVRLDMLSNRPDCVNRYVLQGTAGAYESGRAEGDAGRLWCAECGGRGWRSAGEFEDILPAWYKHMEREGRGSGHSGADFATAWDFVRACRGMVSVSIGVREAVTWTAAGLLSQRSIALGGVPLAVPPFEAFLAEHAWGGLGEVGASRAGSGRGQLAMRLHTAASVEPAGWPLPAGYDIRPAAMDDAEGLARCLSVVFASGWDAQRVHRQLLGCRDVSATSVVTHAGTVVATASVITLPATFPDAWCLHLVAAMPEHRGRHLGGAVSLAVMKRAQELQPRDFVLQTDDERLSAIATYLRLGFQPEYRRPGDAERWASVLAALLQVRMRGVEGRTG